MEQNIDFRGKLIIKSVQMIDFVIEHIPKNYEKSSN